MNNVRNYSKTSIVLFLILAGIFLLSFWSQTATQEFILEIKILLESKKHLGGYHSLVVSFSFGILLFSAIIEAIISEKRGLEIVSAFALPFFFSLGVTIWGWVATYTRISIAWFWFSYYIGLIICVWMAYTRITIIHGIKGHRIRLILYHPFLDTDPKLNIIDKCVLYIMEILLLLDWIVTMGFLVVYVWQNKLILMNI